MDTDSPFLILNDGRGVWVYPLTYGRARLGVGAITSGCMDDVW